MGISDATRDLRKLGTGVRWRAEFLVGTRIPSEYPAELRSTIKRVRRDTLSSAQRLAALCDAVEYLVRKPVEGDIVECGVWRGGSMMAAALTLQRLGESGRELYLFDTFAGMTRPTEEDAPSPYDPYSLQRRWRRSSQDSSGASGWGAVPVERVEEAMRSTGYPSDSVHCVPGMVEDTLPDRAPERIALLRLDTDWYASTKHELEQLYPRLVDGGVLIIDDYGHYEGARKAVDEYFEEIGETVLLNRIDYTGRLAVRTEAHRGAAE
jgi:O-methyltransferase